MIPYAQFNYDEAYFYEEALLAAQNFSFPWKGVFITGSNGFTPGGGFYFLQSLPFYLTHDPLWGSLWPLILSFLAILFLNTHLKNLPVDPMLRFFIIMTLIWSFRHAHNTDRI